MQHIDRVPYERNGQPCEIEEVSKFGGRDLRRLSLEEGSECRDDARRRRIILLGFWMHPPMHATCGEPEVGMLAYFDQTLKKMGGIFVIVSKA
jgi:hypothetical protein